MLEHTSDVYLHSNDDRSPKERITDLESKVESIIQILSKISAGMEITNQFMDNQNMINQVLVTHHKLLTNLSEAVDLISNFIPRIKQECIND